jgi:hypothetical protein
MDVTDDLLSTITREQVDANAIRCPDETAAAKMIQVCSIALSLMNIALRQLLMAKNPDMSQLVSDVRDQEDSIGGM